MALDDNLYGSNSSTIRKQTAGERFSAFFDPFNKRDTAGITREEADTNEGNNAGAIMQIQTSSLGDMQELYGVSDFKQTNGAFASQEAFDIYKEKNKASPENFAKITPGDLVVLGKFKGGDKESEYISKAAEINNRLGIDYKIYGEGKFLDIAGSTFGIDESGTYGITNPSIRSFKNDKDSTPFFYSADATANGENFENMSPQEIEESNKTLRGLLVDNQGNAITPRMITDRAFTASYSNFLNNRPGYGQGRAMIDVMGQDNSGSSGGGGIESETNKTILDGNTSRIDKLKAIQAEINAAGAAEADSSGAGVDSLTAGRPELTIRDKDKTLTKKLDAAIRSDFLLTKGNKYIQTNGTVFNMTPDEFNSLSIADQDKYSKEAVRISNRNIANIQINQKAKVNAAIEAARNAGPVTGNMLANTSTITTEDRKAQIETVENFYKEIAASGEDKGKNAHKKLIMALQNNPEKLQEYKDDPYQFALNNSVEDIQGSPLSDAQEALLRKGLDNVDSPALKKALNDPKTTDADIEEIINSQIAAYTEQSDAIKKQQSNIPAVKNQNLGQASFEAKYAAILQIALSLPQGSDLRKSLINKDVLVGFFNTGKLIPLSALSGRGRNEQPDNTLSDNISAESDEIFKSLQDGAIYDLVKSSGQDRDKVVDRVLSDANIALTKTFKLIKTNRKFANPNNQSYLQSINSFRAANSSYLRQQIKNIAKKSFVDSLLETIPFVADQGQPTENFLNALPTLTYDDKAKMFNITLPNGKSSKFNIDAKDAQKIGPAFLQSLKQQAEMNALINSGRPTS